MGRFYRVAATSLDIPSLTNRSRSFNLPLEKSMFPLSFSWIYRGWKRMLVQRGIAINYRRICRLPLDSSMLHFLVTFRR